MTAMPRRGTAERRSLERSSSGVTPGVRRNSRARAHVPDISRNTSGASSAAKKNWHRRSVTALRGHFIWRVNERYIPYGITSFDVSASSAFVLHEYSFLALSPNCFPRDATRSNLSSFTEIISTVT